MNTCRERIKSSVSKRIIKDLESLADEGTNGMLEDVLDRKMSMAMIDMSRIPLRNRWKNDLFTILLKRKLRLDLWSSSDCPLCKQTDRRWSRREVVYDLGFDIGDTASVVLGFVGIGGYWEAAGYEAVEAEGWSIGCYFIVNLVVCRR